MRLGIIAIVFALGTLQMGNAAQATAKNLRPRQDKQSVAALRSTPEWTGLQAQLDQYTNHLAQFDVQRTQATNKIAKATNTVAQVNTALNAIQDEVDKQQQMTDDIADAVKKLKKLVFDSVKIQEGK